MSKYEKTSTFRAAKLAALLARHYPDAQPHIVADLVFRMQRETRAALAYENRRNINPCDEIDDIRSKNRFPLLTNEERQDIMERETSTLEGLSEKMMRAEIKINLALSFADLRIDHDPRNGPHELHARPAQLHLGGDPRGPCGSLIIPGDPGDRWGGGYSIY